MREAKWVVIGRPGCDWCDKVRYLLTEKGIPHTYLNYEEHPGLKTFLVTSDLKTVPQVFVDGTLIGGFEDTEETLEDWYRR
jgi:glutaredoxin